MTYYLKCFFNFFENPNGKAKIWIGNINTSRDCKFLKENDIKLVINCTKDLPQTYHFYPEFQTIDFQRIPVNDSRTEKDINLMERYMEGILEIIKCYISNDKSILIFCRAGKQRSAIVSTLFLYDYYSGIFPQKNKDEIKKMAFDRLYNCRPQVFTCGLFVNFEKSLELFLEKRAQKQDKLKKKV